MSNSSSSSTTNNPPTSQTTQDNSSDAQTTISSSLDSTKSPTNNSISTPTATVLPSDGLREDLIKQAVSFLSSANVRSADKEKKMAFLQKKGLNQAEIDEAFKRVGGQSIANISTINTTAPAIPLRNYTPSLIPTTQILYYPQPPQPSLPAEKVFALSVILGMGAVGLTASMIGLLKHFISPIFNRIAEYQRIRYNQHKEVSERLLKSLKNYHLQNDDLDALIDQGEEKTVTDALMKHEAEFIDKISKLAEKSQEYLSNSLKTKIYKDFRSELAYFKDALMTSTSYSDYPYYSTSYLRTNTSPSDSSAVAGLKSDIRSLKAVLLNTRNFPTV